MYRGNSDRPLSINNCENSAGPFEVKFDLLLLQTQLLNGATCCCIVLQSTTVFWQPFWFA